MISKTPWIFFSVCARQQQKGASVRLSGLRSRALPTRTDTFIILLKLRFPLSSLRTLRPPSGETATGVDSPPGFSVSHEERLFAPILAQADPIGHTTS